jgi:BirA family biotin operon repressor/biotin-[acetyl-CoA-carboxylase] ligase
MIFANSMPTPIVSFDADKISQSSFIRHVEIYDELGSTNDRAAELAGILETPLPALVATRQQTAGRGRGTNRWWAADGALTFSLLIDTSMHGVATRDWPRLSLATAVAICDALASELRAAGTGLAIKWPNDVMLDGAKVSGILVESPAGAASRERIVIGIGINVNNSWRAAPRETGGLGIALCEVTGRQHNLNTVLIATLNAIQFRIRQLAENAPELPQAWQQRCWLTEQDVEVGSGSDWMQGVCTGIDHDGALLVQNLFGAKRFYSGSVKVL